MDILSRNSNISHSAPETRQSERKGSRWFYLNRWEGLLLYLPAILLVLALKGWPLIQGFYLSLTTQKVVGQNIFVGFSNYQKIFTDKIFLTSLVNILKSLAALPVFIIVPLIIAFFIHQRVPGWKFFRATYFFSYLLAPVMVGYMFSFLLGSYGPINTFLKRIGLDVIAINWLGNPKSSIFVVFGVILWSWFGLGALIYLASMATIEEDLYECAKLDGATNWQVMFYITIPHIMPTIGYWSVLVTTSFFIGLFPFIYALTGGGPGYATMMPEYYIYIVATQFLKSGYASALGVVLFFVIFVLTLMQIKLMYTNELS